jgi:RNA recognition motif-containing protein
MELKMQGQKLYVGNLNLSTTTEELSELFAPYGQVENVKIIEGKGFGFVRLTTTEAAENAKNGLNNTEFKNQILKVNDAHTPSTKPRPDHMGRASRFGEQNNNNNRNKGGYTSLGGWSSIGGWPGGRPRINNNNRRGKG